jgi:quinoprotein glucose dehydrogenase
VPAALLAGGALAGAALAAAALAGGARPATDRPADASGRARAITEWAASGGGGGSHFSALADVSRENVHRLRVAWMYRTGDVSDGWSETSATSFQATPIMVDGTLYFPTPFSRIIALDAESGAERWVFDPRVDRSAVRRSYVTSRGVATWVDAARQAGETCRRRILAATVDARLIALDARTGAPCADFGARGQVDLRVGVRGLRGEGSEYRETAPPVVIDDVVVVGSSVTDNARADAPSGVVRGFDARTGRVRWSWEPLVDVASSVGREASGARRAFRAGAANAWGTITADSARHLVLVPTSSASPDHYGGLRPGANRWANSVVALDARSGRLVWGFQLVHHDLWEYDVPAPPALVEVRRGGR